MEELAYIYTSGEGEETVYTIVEYDRKNQFQFMRNGDFVHRAVKENGRWVQADGNEAPAEVIAALGTFMDQHHQAQ